MANEALRIDIASEFTGKKAFGQAETATQKLTSSVKNLGKAIGISFGALAAVNYLKQSTRAAVEAQAQQDRLARLLKVTTNASDYQIASLNAQADALERLGVITKGSITQIQSQLATFNLQTDTISALTPAILDYVTAEKGATASTEEFKQMTNGLAQALNGNFASLTRTGFVLDAATKAIIKNGTESERTAAIVAVLESTYKGFNESLRDTPVGQMQLLANAAEDAKTIIGTGLIQALGDAGGTSGLTGSLSAIAKLATTISDLFVGIGRTVAAIAPFFSGKNLLDSIKEYRKITKGFREDDLAATRKAQMAANNYGGLTGYTKKYYDAQAKKNQAALLKTQKEQLKVTKEQTALQKAGTLFDIQQAGIIAALKGKITDEERTRLELQLAILTGNTSEASKLAAELAKSQGLTQSLVAFYSALPDAKNPFSGWITTLLNAQQLAASIAAGNYNTAPTLVTSIAGNAGTQYSLPQASTQTSAAGVEFTVNVNAGSIIAQESLQDVLRDTLLDASLSAKFASIFRQGGSFGP